MGANKSLPPITGVGVDSLYWTAVVVDVVLFREAQSSIDCTGGQGERESRQSVIQYITVTP